MIEAVFGRRRAFDGGSGGAILGGKRYRLRLRQEFFFSSASLQDILRRHLQQYPDFTSLPE
ncbi:glycogen/starch/alpha-glucan phosphorylase, partial [Agrobacterium tumefaciens]|nr:glycogen/starch/alpha-glucan phosphorylase [Agrobacterium tumefaciens]